MEIEQLVAQKMAFDHQPTQPWHQHLIAPSELRMLFDKARKYDAAMQRIKNLVNDNEPTN